jgi:diketogulonate reductase-like aldo/keto reductase
MAEAERLSKTPLVTNQVEWHPYIDQTIVHEAARQARMSVTAYYAMADGKVFDDVVLKSIASRHGKSVAQVVLRWLIQHDGVMALSKTVSEERAASNAAIFDFELSETEMTAIRALARRDGRIVSPSGLAPVWD